MSIGALNRHPFLADYYELTMMNGIFQSEVAGKKLHFDVYFRQNPDRGGFSIAAGLEQMIDYIENLRFGDDEIAFLRAKGIFADDFLAYLRKFKFTGDIYAMPEGTPMFPNEPFVRVRAPAIEAQLIETSLLLILNHQSLIATKANRIVYSAQGRPVAEFGARRAHGASAALYGARAAYIGGVSSTSCTLADLRFEIPASGTMAHSWVQMFDDEYESFRAYCERYPNNTTLLVDTYDVLRSGIPNAVRAIKDVLLPLGVTDYAIRIDSGDLTYLSKRSREMLDAAGLPNCKIVVSNSLDEYVIGDLLLQGAAIDAFGVGERLITSKSTPVFGGVYKLVAVEDEGGTITPKIKISENQSKITTPGVKQVYRLFENGKASADLVCLDDEVIDTSKPLEIFDPDAVWKRKTLTDFTARELLVPIFINGERVYECPPLPEVRDYCAAEVDLLWDEVRRFEQPHNYYVDLSLKLWTLRQALLLKNG